MMEKQPIPETDEGGFDPGMMETAGYSAKAIRFCNEQPNRGVLSDADQVSEVAGPCGDSITVYLRIREGKVDRAKALVSGCPGAVASAMAAMELAKGKTLTEALAIEEKDIVRMLEYLPDEKQDCIQLSAKALHKAVEEYVVGGPSFKKRE
ncbi:nitrogen fixation protein NifU [Desulfatibacillum alkenivorans DSM 16219]|jgi:nitrogen fixation NifU-like protein|uniref:Nitrogen fixation protein NifU n=1 Tax=Desulfatibacillum alkenivorans DSM 16219 TaxID=1121393 RepID=A0A1M6XHM7_9BACT|nr:iron-sulfur cluster assembly scaffold protein [Desulfatibacillum alkenivorans]SHL05359.1 nitrogen fixation protein NifU [Desulfatibacillum alkenivorans DSM 16219]